MIPLQVVDEAVLLPVKAQAGARRDSIVGEHAGRLKVAVTQIAEAGKANAAICELIARSLEVAKSRVSVESGATSPLKVLRLEGIALVTVESWLSGHDGT